MSKLPLKEPFVSALPLPKARPRTVDESLKNLGELIEAKKAQRFVPKSERESIAIKQHADARKRRDDRMMGELDEG